tara:strand:+ start:153 stop:1019 length:867 start_codon:yes stop_codon:yes gene_type:complete
MAELKDFENFIKDKSANTIKSYKQQYNKLKKIVDTEMEQTIDIQNISEKNILEFVSNENNLNSQQALLNIAILIRKMQKPPQPITKLEKQREENKSKLQGFVKEKNEKLKSNGLPTYQDLLDYLAFLYNSERWTDFIINYLLIYFNTRNMDLNFELVPFKRDIKANPDINYLWYSKRAKKATLYRRDYKTVGKYGMKQNIITDPKFLNAIKQIFECRKKGEGCGVFIPNKENVGYYIQKATLDNLGEGTYVKIIINHFRNNLDKLSEISDNRGTSLKILKESYDIDTK